MMQKSNISILADLHALGDGEPDLCRQKKSKKGGGGLMDMLLNFQGYQRNSMWSLFLALEFPRDLTFDEYPGVELVLSGISGVGIKK